MIAGVDRGTGQGRTKKEAEQRAAETAWRSLSELAAGTLRRRGSAVCRSCPRSRSSGWAWPNTSPGAQWLPSRCATPAQCGATSPESWISPPGWPAGRSSVCGVAASTSGWTSVVRGVAGPSRDEWPDANPATRRQLTRRTCGCDCSSPTAALSCALSTSARSADCPWRTCVDGLPIPVAHIARDPMDPCFDADAVIAGIRQRRTALKRALLDQTLVSGIGNIYADEALWRARLHGARLTATLTRAQGRTVLTAVTEVMTEALAAGGTSFDALYVNIKGASGYFDRSLAVYGQEGRPCPRCGTPIRRESFMNRSSHYCPRCQPRPRQPLSALDEGR